MLKRFTPLALLFGLLTALLLGSASTAQATSLLGFQCHNGSPVGVVVCVNNVLNQVTVTITGNRALTADELHAVENSLNNINVGNGNAVYLGNLEVATVDAYDSFNPEINITKDNVNACIASLCV